jgi:uncharacterized membrane protein
MRQQASPPSAICSRSPRALPPSSSLSSQPVLRSLVSCTHLLHATGGLTTSAVRFGAAYLLSHGVVKIVLVGALLRNKAWAYPWMIVFLILFIAYQIYRIALAFSVDLVGLTIFDAVVVWLTYHEYLKQRSISRTRRR